MVFEIPVLGAVESLLVPVPLCGCSWFVESDHALLGWVGWTRATPSGFPVVRPLPWKAGPLRVVGPQAAQTLGSRRGHLNGNILMQLVIRILTSRGLFRTFEEAG